MASKDTTSAFKKIWDTGTSYLFAYETPKVVNIQSKRIGAMHRLVQIGIIAYVIGYVFIWNKGYQDVDRVESSVVTKVKGVLRSRAPFPMDMEIWDSVDFIVPSQENNAFFIATNIIATRNQRQGRCPEVHNASELARAHVPGDVNIGVPGVTCATDMDCKPTDSMIVNGNGFRTGKCVNYTNTCEITAWCPTEVDVRPEPPVLGGSENFTILVKNHIMFPKFNVKRRNILDHMNGSYLANCRYHPVSDPFCPIFVLKDLLTLAGEDYNAISKRGGVIGFVIEWNCNLDMTPDNCLPVYLFRRMDNKDDKLAKGWNFRYAHYWTDQNGIQRRTMLKAYGIRFVFNVYGRAGKFSAVVFAMNLGSGIGLLGIATILCDFVLLHCLKNRDTFSEFKFVRLESKALRRGSRAPPTLRNDEHSDMDGDTISALSPRQQHLLAPGQVYRPYSNDQIQTAIDDIDSKDLVFPSKTFKAPE